VRLRICDTTFNFDLSALNLFHLTLATLLPLSGPFVRELLGIGQTDGHGVKRKVFVMGQAAVNCNVQPNERSVKLQKC